MHHHSLQSSRMQQPTPAAAQQLWPCQRLCSRCTPQAPLHHKLPLLPALSAAPQSSPCTWNTSTCSISRQQSRSVAAASATQPPSPTEDGEQQHEAGFDNHQQQQQQEHQQQQRHEPSSTQHRRGSRSSSSAGTGSPLSIDDPQLLVGDCVALVAAALYRQIASIVLSPSFPGWFAPLSFNPLRFAEFANFAGMLVASWVVAATLTGGYGGAAVGAGVPGALRAACKAWLVAMPICAAQLVLVTATESQALVGDSGFAEVLPLAAHGPGEPLGTAAALLGLMAMWRAFYAAYLDTWAWASARDVAEDAARFRETLASVALVAAGCTTLLQVLQLTATLGGAAADGVDVGQMLGLGPW